MAATTTTATTFSIESALSYASKPSPFSQSKAFGVRYNSKNNFRSFSGLKVATTISCASESSFFGKNSCAALQVSSDLQELTEYEQRALEALKPELKASIEKGVAFAQKQPVAA